MSRPKPGTIVPLDSREYFSYDPEMIFQPKEYVGYATKQDEMVFAREF